MQERNLNAKSKKKFLLTGLALAVPLVGAIVSACSEVSQDSPTNPPAPKAPGSDEQPAAPKAPGSDGQPAAPKAPGSDGQPAHLKHLDQTDNLLT